MKGNTLATRITTQTTYPTPVTQTGTISGAANSTVITGAGTDFQGELEVGGWLWHNNELKQILSIHAKEMDVTTHQQILTIDSAFGSAPSTDTLNYIAPPEEREITLINDGAAGAAADGTVDGQVFPANQTLTWFFQGNRNRTADPIEVDGTGTSIQVLIIK